MTAHSMAKGVAAFQPTSSPPPSGDFLVTEGGDFIVTESGDRLLA